MSYRTYVLLDGSTVVDRWSAPSSPGPGWTEATGDQATRALPGSAPMMPILPRYPNDAAAAAAGLPAGSLYMNLAGVQQIQGGG